MLRQGKKRKRDMKLGYEMGGTPTPPHIIHQVTGKTTQWMRNESQLQVNSMSDITIKLHHDMH